MASSMSTGPTLQLHPMTSAPHSSRRGVNVSGVEPSRQLPSSSTVTCGDDGDGRTYVAGGEHRLMNLFQIAEGLQNQ